MRFLLTSLIFIALVGCSEPVIDQPQFRSADCVRTEVKRTKVETMFGNYQVITRYRLTCTRMEQVGHYVTASKGSSI